MPFYKANGINIHVEDIGDGEPLIMIPGLSGDSFLWRFQIDYFKDFFRVIAIDNRGAGKSDTPEEEYTMKMFAKDLNDLLDKMDIDDPINLMAASMGGIIAQSFIHDYPHRVKRLILACSGVSAGDPHYTMLDKNTYQKIENPGSTSEEKANSLVSIFYHKDFLKKNPDIANTYLERKRTPQPKHAYQAQLKACFDDRPYYEWLPDINIPTFIIHGNNDIIWPVQNAYTLLEGIGDNAEIYIMEKAGHILFHEKVEEFNKIVHDFLIQN